MSIDECLRRAAESSNAEPGDVPTESEWMGMRTFMSRHSSKPNDPLITDLKERAAALPPPPSERALTDLGNAERFADQHRESARYVGAWNSWMVWDGKRWQRDTSNRVALLAKVTARSIDKEVEHAGSDERRASLRKHATKSESRAGIENMIALARGELAAAPNDFDVDPWLLNVNNGTLDLRTGQLRPHAREDMLTKLARVDSDPNARCPQWDDFVSWAMAGNTELVAFLRRAVGYSLAGVTSEHVLVFSHGEGRNGKGVFHNTVARILGDYASKAPRGLLVESRNERPPNELADLHGARFVLCAEVKQGQRFDEGLIKDLVGEDRIKARKLYQDLWEFTPTHTLFLCGNHKPVIHGSDDGIWRRMRLVPWLVQISEDAKDTKLAEKLSLESSGILAWAVRGCLEWQENGLGAPGVVKEATEAFRKESNRLHEFLEARCKLAPELKVARRSLRAAYEAWCKEVGREPLHDKGFAACLRERSVTDGGTVREKPSPNPQPAWKGIGLL
jgi:putative DNA primase/helicase